MKKKEYLIFILLLTLPLILDISLGVCQNENDFYISDISDGKAVIRADMPENEYRIFIYADLMENGIDDCGFMLYPEAIFKEHEKWEANISDYNDEYIYYAIKIGDAEASELKPGCLKSIPEHKQRSPPYKKKILEDISSMQKFWEGAK
jgi:hypothetical protein